jgi:hypothetical protein
MLTDSNNNYRTCVLRLLHNSKVPLNAGECVGPRRFADHKCLPTSMLPYLTLLGTFRFYGGC